VSVPPRPDPLYEVKQSSIRKNTPEGGWYGAYRDLDEACQVAIANEAFVVGFTEHINRRHGWQSGGRTYTQPFLIVDYHEEPRLGWEPSRWPHLPQREVISA
jgi:hypothetical protein